MALCLALLLLETRVANRVYDAMVLVGMPAEQRKRDTNEPPSDPDP